MNNNENTQGMDWLGIGLGAANVAGGLVGKIGQKKRERRQLGYQKELMGIQQQNQMELNKQGADLAYQMWLDTNAQAQMRELEKAGLNPALMYGQGGPGGTTAAGSGGSAQGGNAPNVENIGMDIGNIVQASLASAQKDLIKAQEENVKADTVKKAGVDTELVSGQIGLLAQQTKSEQAKRYLLNAQEAGQSIENMINAGTAEDQMSEIQYQARTAASNMRIAANEDKLLAESLDDRLYQIGQEAVGARIANLAAMQGIELDKMKIKEISASIAQKWASVSQGWKGLSQKDKDLQLKEFELQLKKEYPNVQQALGRVLDDGYQLMENITGSAKGKYSKR